MSSVLSRKASKSKQARTLFVERSIHFQPPGFVAKNSLKCAVHANLILLNNKRKVMTA